MVIIASTTPTNEASQVNHSSQQRQSRSLANMAIEAAFHRSILISIISSCFSLELQEGMQTRIGLGSGGKSFRNKAGGSERHMDRRQKRAYTVRVCPVRRRPLLFG